jgi:hypothetical protein
VFAERCGPGCHATVRQLTNKRIFRHWFGYNRKLLEMPNKGIFPDVPCKGSVGASGDLAPLFHIALVMMGEGEA